MSALYVEKPLALTQTGDLITDAVRLAAIEGDGRAPDGSTGFWPAAFNNCSNGSFETDLAGWTSFQGGVLARDNANAKFGGWAQKLTTPGVTVAGGGEGNNGPQSGVGSAAQGQTWTASTWVYSAAGGEQVSWSIEEFSAGGGFLTALSVNYVLVPGWQRLAATKTLSNATVSRVNGCLRTITAAQAITVWLDGVQYEQYPIATPYDHRDDSAFVYSFGRLAGMLTAPVSPLFDPARFWVAAYLRMGFDAAAPPTTTASLRIAALTDGAAGVNAGRLLLMYRPNAGNVFAMFNADNTGASDQAASAAQTFVKGAKRFVVGYASPTQVKLSLDGAAFTTVARTHGVPVPTRFDIGSETAAAVPIHGDVLWLAARTPQQDPTDADVNTLWRRVLTAEPGHFADLPPSFR